METTDIQKILEEQRKQALIFQKTEKQINSTIANRLNAQDPEWRAAHAAATSTKEYKQKVAEGRARFWAGDTEEHRKKIAESSFNKSISFSSKEQAEEIFWKCWGEDRGEKLYKKLAKEYDVGFDGIVTLVRGRRTNAGLQHHAWCPVDPITLEKMKKEWLEKYQSYTVCAVQPGYDQLNNYDRLYKESGLYQKSNEGNRMATPSVVFHCRFMLPNPNLQSVKDYCDSIGIPKINNDLRQYKNILFDKFPWLSNKPSETYEFDSYEDMAEFLRHHEENKTIKNATRELAWDYVKHRIQWKGNNFLGWMFYKKEL